jgi:hypothetical protein
VGYVGGNIQNRCFFWKLSNITQEKLNLMGLSPTNRTVTYNEKIGFNCLDWLPKAVNQVQADLIFDAPIIPDFIDASDHYLVLANKAGDVVIYRDGNAFPIGISNILKGTDTHIEGMRVHEKYCIIKLYDEYYCHDDQCVFDLDKSTLNGKFYMHEEDGPIYSGKYMIKQDHEHSTGNNTGITFYDLDNLFEKSHSIPEKFADIEYECLESQGKLISYEQSSEYESRIRNREFAVHNINGLSESSYKDFLKEELEKLPIDETLNKERYMYCYDIAQDRFLWKFSLGEYRPRHIHDLKRDKFLVISSSPNYPHIIYQTSTGKIIGTVPYNSTLELTKRIYPVLIPETNQMKYII